MDALANWLWQGCLVAVAAAGMLRLLDRSAAHARYVVCWAALAAILLLPAAPLLSAAAAPAVIGDTTVSPVIRVPSAWWASGAVAAAAWLLWSALAALRLALAWSALRRVKCRCVPFPPAMEARLEHWQRLRGTGRRARLCLSDHVSTASVLGGTSPLVAVSPRLIDELGPAEIDRVVVHEWAHVQRRDDCLHLFQRVVMVVAGWHPALWWLDRRLHAECEIACDEIVVAETGSRKDYAACLARLATLRTAPSEPLPVPGALSSAVGRRVVRILSASALAPRVWTTCAGATCVLLLSVLSLTAGAFPLVDAATLSPVPFASVAPRANVPRPVAPRPMHLRARHDSTRVPAGLGERAVYALAVRPPVVDRAAAPPDEDRAALHASAHATRAIDVYSASPLVALAVVPQVGRESPGIAHAHAPDSARAAARVVETGLDSRGTGAVTVWGAAAAAGVAVADGSRKAGVVTAGFFNRVGKRIAGSF